jgi:hypothetical protein
MSSPLGEIEGLYTHFGTHLLTNSKEEIKRPAYIQKALPF